MLLVFDEVTFVDPVDDARCRAKLFEDLEFYDSEFARYQGVDAALPELIQQGCIKRFDPGPDIDNRSSLPYPLSATWMTKTGYGWRPTHKTSGCQTSE